MKATGSVALLLIVALATPGCAGFSKEARSRRAYEKYVNKSRAGRAQQQTKVQRTQQEVPPASVSDPVESTSAGPEGGGPSDG